MSDNKHDNAREVYRHTLDFSKISDKQLIFGVVRSLGVSFGVDWNTKNDSSYGSKKRMLVLGPTLMMGCPWILEYQFDGRMEKQSARRS